MIRETVAEMLGYLCVDKRIERSVYKRLVPVMEAEGVTDPNKIYRRLTGWIDACNVPYIERTFEGLDSPRGPDDDRLNGTKYFDPHAESSLDALISREECVQPFDRVKISSMHRRRVVTINLGSASMDLLYKGRYDDATVQKIYNL